MRGDLEEKEKTLNSENIIKISLLSDSESDDESFELNKICIKNKSNKKKSTQLKFRNDVIFKTIFRSFRKHCIRDFKTYFDFIKQKGDSIRLTRKVKNYMFHRFGFENELLCAIFICIIDTRHKYSQVDENYEDVATKINDLMYNFSNNKMLELIDCDEFALIFCQAFLRQPDIVNKVLKNRNDSPLKKTYKMHISKLLSLSSRN